MNTKKMTYPILGILASVSLILLAIVDFRRGFLFNKADYWHKTSYYVFSPLQLILVALGVAGILLLYRTVTAINKKDTNLLLLGILVLLLIDAGFYRGVAASRSIDAGKIGIDWLGAFGTEGLLKPFALSVSYVLTVWHAIVLSCLGAGLALLAMPRILDSWQRQAGILGAVSGTLYALTQPFCSCCVALTSPGLFRSRRSMTFALSVILGAPLLNISTLILAGNFLPFPYAVLRIAGGLAVTLILSYILSRWLVGQVVRSDTSISEEAGSLDCDVPSTIFSNWLKLSGKISVILIPSMVFGTLLSSAVWSIWPQEVGNSVVSVILTSVIGSLVMVSTWSEIPLAGQLIAHGLTGPAAAVLVALPAVNLGSLLILFKVSKDWKIPVGLGAGVMVISVLAGIAFL